MLSASPNPIVHVVIATEADRGFQGWAVRGHSEWISAAAAERLRSKAPSPFFLEREEVPPLLAGVSPEAFATDRNIEAIHISVLPTEHDIVATFSGTIHDPVRPARPWRIITRVFQLPEVAWEELGGDVEGLLYRFEEGAPQATEWFSRALPARFRGELPVPTITPSLDDRPVYSGSTSRQRLDRLRWFASRLDRPVQETARRIAQIHQALKRCWSRGGSLILTEPAGRSTTAIEARLAWLSLSTADRRRVELTTGRTGDSVSTGGLSVVSGPLPGRLPDGSQRLRLEQEPDPDPHWVAHLMGLLVPDRPGVGAPRELSLLDGEFELWTDVLAAEYAYRHRRDSASLKQKLRRRLVFPDPLQGAELESVVDQVVGILDPKGSLEAVADTLDSVLTLPYPERTDVSELTRRVLHELLDAPIASWQGAAAHLIVRFMEEGNPALDETDGLCLLRHEAHLRDQGVEGPIGFLDKKAGSPPLLLECLQRCRHLMAEGEEVAGWGSRMAMEASGRYRPGLSQIPQPRSDTDAYWVLSLLDGYLKDQPRHADPLPLPAWLISSPGDSVCGVHLSRFPAVALQRLEQAPEDTLISRLSREGIEPSLFISFLSRWAERHPEGSHPEGVWAAWTTRIQAANLSLRTLEIEQLERLGRNPPSLPAWWPNLVSVAIAHPRLRAEALARCAEGLGSPDRLRWAGAILAELSRQIFDEEVVGTVAESLHVVATEESDQETILKAVGGLRPAGPSIALALVHEFEAFERMDLPSMAGLAANLRQSLLRVSPDCTWVGNAQEREAFFELWWWEHEPGTSSPGLPGLEQLSSESRTALIDWLLRGTPPAPLFALLKRHKRNGGNGLPHIHRAPND